MRGKALGRKLPGKAASIASPDTILTWHRKLVAKKSDCNVKRGPGRHWIMAEIANLFVRMIQIPGWGYTRIRGALMNITKNGTIKAWTTA